MWMKAVVCLFQLCLKIPCAQLFDDVVFLERTAGVSKYQSTRTVRSLEMWKCGNVEMWKLKYYAPEAPPNELACTGASCDGCRESLCRSQDTATKAIDLHYTKAAANNVCSACDTCNNRKYCNNCALLYVVLYN